MMLHNCQRVAARQNLIRDAAALNWIATDMTSELLQSRTPQPLWCMEWRQRENAGVSTKQTVHKTPAYVLSIFAVTDLVWNSCLVRPGVVETQGWMRHHRRQKFFHVLSMVNNFPAAKYNKW